MKDSVFREMASTSQGKKRRLTGQSLQPAFARAAASASLASHDAELPADEEEDEAELDCLGYVAVSCVGIQYYTGTVSNGEMVKLVREPNNMYDRYAIRVDNVRGVQVGHVERYKACHLSPLVDSGLVHLEGLVPRGTENKFKMPCNVFLFCRPDDAGAVSQRLLQTGLYLMPLEGGKGPGSGAGVGLEGSGRKLSVAEQETELEKLFSSLAHGANKRLLMEPPECIKTPLFNHQKEALAWMVGRENNNSLPPFWEARSGRGNRGLMYMNSITNFATQERPLPLRGGILADDMGLGKTLALVTLIALNSPGATPPAPTEADIVTPITGGPPAKKHKAGTAKSAAEKGKGKALVVPDPPPSPPAANGPKPTLIVCPLSVLSNWSGQLAEHVHSGALSLYIYHGSDRIRDPQVLAKFDVVLTTYSTLAYEGVGTGAQKPPLQAVQWLRVILDEAHCIKSSTAQQAIAAAALQAERRWVVTGTPIQNKLADLYSLLAFLRLEPLNDKSFWQRTIERPVKAGDPRGLPRLQVLMSAVALRRTKDMEVDGRKLVELPPKTVIIQEVELSPEDRVLYDRWEHEGQQIISGLLAAGTVMQNYASVLEIILRSRQICDHASLCPAHKAIGSLPAAAAGEQISPEDKARLLGLLQAGADDECPICLSLCTLPTITICAHVFCRRCIQAVMARDKPLCPLCRGKLQPSQLIEAPPEDDPVASTPAGDQLTGVKPSAKSLALLSCLQQIAAKDPSAKSVVFSQFTRMLDHVQALLQGRGFRIARLDGSMIAAKRQAALESFKSLEPGSPTVFLMSLKAAGVGLNLVTASRCFLLDPWWNYSVEEQAMDRIHRLGQTRAVEVVRFVVKDSIEERMLELQARKKELAKSAFEKRSAEQQRTMRIEDVRLLMRL